MPLRLKQKQAGAFVTLGCQVAPAPPSSSALSNWQNTNPVNHGDQINTSNVGVRASTTNARLTSVPNVTWNASHPDGPSWVVTGPISGVEFDANVIFDATNAPYTATEWKVSVSNTSYRPYDVRVLNGAANRKVLLSNFDILGNSYSGVGLGEDNFIAVRGRIHGQGRDHVNLSRNSELHECLIHQRVLPADPLHYTDGVQISRGNYAVVYRCNIDLMLGSNGYSSTFAGVFLKPETAEGVGKVTVTENFINGGKYSLAVVNHANGYFFFNGGNKSLIVKNNKFGIDSEYGAFHFSISTGPDIEIDATNPLFDWFNNTWGVNGTHRTQGSVSAGQYIWTEDPAGANSRLALDALPNTISVNQGATVTLTASVTGLPTGVTISSWLWTDNQGFTSTSPNSINYTASTVGTFSIFAQVTLSNSQVVSDQSTVVVTSPSAPTVTINGPTSVPLNSSAVWTVTTTGQTLTNLSWSVAGAVVSTLGSYTRVVNAAFTLVVTATFVSGATDTDSISVLAPSGSVGPVANGIELNASNTGIAALGLTLGNLTNLTSSQIVANTTYTNRRVVDGGLTISVPNVKLVGCLIERTSFDGNGRTTYFAGDSNTGADSPNGILIRNAGGSNFQMEFCTVIGNGFNKTSINNTNGLSHKIYRCNLSGGEDGIKANSNGEYTENFVHDHYWRGPDPHADCLQLAGANRSNINIIRNHFLCKWNTGENSNNCCFQFGSFNGSNDGVQDTNVIGNYFKGGNAFYQNNNGGVYRNILWRNNKFSADYTAYNGSNPLRSRSSMDVDGSNVWSDGPKVNQPI